MFIEEKARHILEAYGRQSNIGWSTYPEKSCK